MGKDKVESVEEGIAWCVLDLVEFEVWENEQRDEEGGENVADEVGGD